MPLRDSVRFLEAPAATRRRGVLRDEDGMVAPRRLPAVIVRLGGRNTLADEVARLLHHMRQPPGLQIGELAIAQRELAPERRRAEAPEDFVDRNHADIMAR